MCMYCAAEISTEVGMLTSYPWAILSCIVTLYLKKQLSDRCSLINIQNKLTYVKDIFSTYFLC